MKLIGLTINYKDKYNQQLQSIKDNYKTFDLPYNGQDNPDYVNGKGFSSNDDTPEAAQARAMVKTRAGEAGTNERMQFYYHPDHLGSSSYITNLDGEVSQHIEYVPFGEVFIDELELTRKSATAGKANCNNTWNTPYRFNDCANEGRGKLACSMPSAANRRVELNAKELDEETGLYYYGARYYYARLSLWMSCDPMQELKVCICSYTYCISNPIVYTDPTGCLESTDVKRNSNGTYTVVNAKNDGDNNIYLVNGKGKRTGEIIGTTLRPYDFMGTDNQNGAFHFNAKETGVTFDISKLTVSGTVKTENATYSVYNANAQRLLDWGQSLFKSELQLKSPLTFYGELEVLRSLSANNAALDVKVSFGQHPYTAINAGTNSNGTPKITTLRAMGNMIFGANVHSTKPYLLGTPNWYYSKVMGEVGKYNQSQNSGLGYNKGVPYFGEHTYSGSYIYYGYYGKFYK